MNPVNPTKWRFLLYSRINDQNIRDRIGVAEYSYYFVLKSFIPMLQRFGEVVTIHTLGEVNHLSLESKMAGMRCVLFCFCPPHSIPESLNCDVVPVFAWEFDTLPNDPKGKEEQGRSDSLNWVTALTNNTQVAITHSSYSKKAVEEALGAGYSVYAIPSPVWDQQASSRRKLLSSKPRKKLELEFTGECLDSQFVEIDQLDRKFDEHMLAGIRPVDTMAGKPDPSGEVAQTSAPGRSVKVEVGGVIYTSIFNPFDYRKNWETMVTAFFHAFRNCADATLLIKISANHYAAFTDRVVDMLRRLEPYDCRIVVLYGFLDSAQYQALMEGTTFYVNTSFSEGQCLPLMEYLSAGIPAIAPRSTALVDYVYPWNALILKSHVEPTHWQHDPREKFRAMHYRVEWNDLVSAYKRSYLLTTKWVRPLYKALQLGAIVTMKFHCSLNACSRTIKKLLNDIVIVSSGN